MKIHARLALALALLPAVALVHGQQPPPAAPAPQTQDAPPPTFRVEVNYVEVDALVTDAQGNPVTNLTADDFEVLEDGRRQTISAFSLVNLPIERADRPVFAEAPIEPDVRTNTTSEGRIYVVVLDDLHTAFTNTPGVKTALRGFFERNFGVNDMAAVVFTSGRAADSQDFTNNRRLLIAAVDKFIGRKLRSEALEEADRLASPFSDPDVPDSRDPMEAERAYNARTAMDSIRQLAEFMGGVRGRRKALLLVSEGISYNIFDVLRNTSASFVMEQTADAVAAATRANVAIYAIDPRGLEAFSEAIEVGSSPAGNSGYSLTRSLLEGLRLSQQSLTVLAAETGGFAAVNRNDFSDAFARIVRENSSYYVLGFYPTNDRRDGRYRRLEVRVRRPGLQVRSRQGYVAPRGRAPQLARGAAAPTPLAAAATDALASPIPIAGIPLTVFAAAYKGTAPNASVAVSIELKGDGFQFTEKDGTFLDRIEVRVAAIDSKGDSRAADSHVVAMTLRPETLKALRARGFRVTSQLDVPPGRYQLRIAVAEEGVSRAGSVLYDLEVPDFYDRRFSMSGLSLASAFETTTMPTARPKDPLRDFLPGPPVATREFRNDDEIALFAEFYENASGAPPHMLDLSTTVRAEGGRVVFEDREERSSADLQGKTGGHGYAVRIPLAAFQPGTYVIRVEGRSRAAAPEAAVGRDVVIRVR